MIFIILSILFNLIMYYFFYIMYGFIITNAIMVIIKTIDFKYRNVLYINLKKFNYINNQLVYLEKLDYKIKFKFMTYLFSCIQEYIIPSVNNIIQPVNNIIPPVNNIIQPVNNIIPPVNNIEEITKENVDNYISTVFNNKQDENNFLSGLEKNLL